MRPLAIIPAYNEEAALPAVLAELALVVPGCDVVVVSDGSKDATAAVARASGAVVLELPYNLGIGGALQTGFRYAARHGYERAFQFDADGQHDPAEVARLLTEIDRGADLVIGSRFLKPEPIGAGGAAEGDGYRVGKARGGAMGVMRFGVRMLSGQRIVDTSSGFRAFSPSMIRHFADTYPAEYMDSVEALLLAFKGGFRVVETPVRMRERAAGQPSNRSFKLAYHFVRLTVVMLSSASLHRPARPA